MHKLWKKLTRWVDRKPSRVTFVTRGIAYAIDWALGGVICGLPAVAIYGLVTKRSDMFSDLYVFPSLGFSYGWSYLAGFLCFIVVQLYYSSSASTFASSTISSGTLSTRTYLDTSVPSFTVHTIEPDCIKSVTIYSLFQSPFS